MSRTLTTLPFAALALVAGASLVSAGPLNPPAGPITSTPGPEPRVALSATNTPGDSNSVFRITQPGSYYLTGNITGASGKHGIEIATSNVTINLNGFTLQGVTGALVGITTDGVRDNITLRGGNVVSWPSGGIDLILGGAGSSCLLEDISASSCTGTGITTSANCVLRNCRAQFNTKGFLLTDNSLVSGCLARFNTGLGFEIDGAATLTDCLAQSNNGHGIYSVGGGSVVRCVSMDNTGIGIVTSSATVSECSASGNGGAGFSTSGSVSDCIANLNTGAGFDVDGGTITRCEARFNQLHGIDANLHARVLDNVSSHNTLDGIRVNGRCVVRGNSCAFNGNGSVGGAGIRATGPDNRIEENNSITNDIGIDVDVAGNVIVKNTCSGNAPNFDFVAGNVFGPIIDRTAPGSPAVSGNSAAGSMGTTDPNANIAY